MLDNGKPVEAVNRAYYAAYQMVTGVLIKIGQTPRQDLGNWSHDDTQILLASRLCRHRRLPYKSRTALKNQIFPFRSLLVMRYHADYGHAGMIDAAVAEPLVGHAGRLLNLLERFIGRGWL